MNLILFQQAIVSIFIVNKFYLLIYLSISFIAIHLSSNFNKKYLSIFQLPICLLIYDYVYYNVNISKYNIYFNYNLSYNQHRKLWCSH